MTFDLQNALILCVVLAAAVYIVRRLLRAVRLKGAGCQACFRCAQPTGRNPTNESPLITINPPEKRPSPECDAAQNARR